ncbi:hypothetical protein [Variovorax sp. UC122_21]|uniref:hypothetical protein n=1 Tax=Variovorax sp. UC122_21 TaxID=3374554 RepID=UPI003757BE4B
MLGEGYFREAGDVITSAAAANKDQRAADAASLDMQLKKMEAMGQIMAGVRDQATYDIARQQAAQIFGPEAAAKISPIYNAQEVEQRKVQALAVKDRLEQQVQLRSQDITRQNNIDTNATSRANNADNLAMQRQKLEFDREQPRGQVVQTDSGTMLVDPRTGVARPVTAGGVPVQKPGKDIPANINKSIIDNQQNISKIDKAMADIRARPESLGTRYMIPGMETVGQYTDADGVQARAGVADIGSLILHDRSGAAVTASETPRLKPFIPQASDRPDVALKKLQRFREIYAEEAGLLAQTYGKDQGYRESPLLTQGAAPRGMAGAKTAGAQRITDKAAFDALPSGTVFIAPDGTTRRKP